MFNIISFFFHAFSFPSLLVELHVPKVCIIMISIKINHHILSLFIFPVPQLEAVACCDKNIQLYVFNGFFILSDWDFTCKMITYTRNNSCIQKRDVSRLYYIWAKFCNNTLINKKVMILRKWVKTLRFKICILLIINDCIDTARENSHVNKWIFILFKKKNSQRFSILFLFMSRLGVF